MQRVSSKSNIEFLFYNDGAIFENLQRYSSLLSSTWPRGIGYADLSGEESAGLWFGCKKSGKIIVSPVGCFSTRSKLYAFNAMNQFVPGVIGQLDEPPDTAFGGVGWKYVENTNYIAYASTDYNAKGVDISGNNFPDWPIRMVNGKASYVHNVLERSKYSPVYRSDQDFFCVFKDTETKADPEFVRAYSPDDTMSVPAGIEVREYCYSFSGALKDIMIITYEIQNKSGTVLDSCFSAFEYFPMIEIDFIHAIADTTWSYYYANEPSRNLVVAYNPKPLKGDNSKTVHVGFDCLESPGNLGTTFWKTITPGRSTLLNYSDTARYSFVAASPSIEPPSKFIFAVGSGTIIPDNGVATPKLFGSYPFRMEIGETVRFSVGIMFAYGLKELLALDDIVQRVSDKGVVAPAPPIEPKLTTAPSPDGILLKWDNAAESSHDPIIDDTLGKPFMGYRLYRSVNAKGPFVKIKEWRVGRDSIIHEYLDKGRDGADSTISGLKMNVSYYFKLTSFDEGALSLGFPEMESPGVVTSSVSTAPASSPYELSNIRIVPNPYIVTHAAQQSIDHPKLFFNYLPEECTIRIYTVALELVAELHHHGGSAEEWDLRTQGGQQVASQLLIAQIETPQGTAVVKKFAVVLAE